MNTLMNKNTAKYFFYKTISPLLYKPSENSEKKQQFLSLFANMCTEKTDNSSRLNNKHQLNSKICSSSQKETKVLSIILKGRKHKSSKTW